MPGAQPDKLPEWASDELRIVEPDESKKDTGWEGTGIVPNEKPRYQYDNWFKNLVYQWLGWLRDEKNFSQDFSAPYWEITYDADDKVQQIRYYESVAKVTLVATQNFSYDADDKVTTIELIVSGVATYTSTLSYDSNDKLTSFNTVES